MTLRAFMCGEELPLMGGFQVSLLLKKHLGELFEILKDPEVNRFLFFAPSPDEVYKSFFAPIVEENADSISKQVLPGSLVVAITEIKSNELVGNAGLIASPMLEGNFDIGFQLRKRAWGLGIGTAVASLLTEIAFDELKAHKVCAELHGGNIASMRVLEKAGYVQEGCQKSYYRVTGGFDDRLLYGITSS